MYLEQRVEELEKKFVELLKVVKAEGIILENTTEGEGLLFRREKKSSKSNNQQRKELIQDAKDFVEDLTNHITDCDGYYRATDYGDIDEDIVGLVYDKVEFKVDYKNRKIEALLDYLDKVYDRGVSKCLDCDVFNVHIGKAIALGKVLGLDVSKFTHAVQPDEVVVGHKLEWKDKNGDYTPLYSVISTEDNPNVKIEYASEKELIGVITRGGNFKTNDWWKIVDDTNAKY